MAITTMDGLVAALGAAQTLNLWLPAATQASGGLVTLNRSIVNSFGQLAQPTAASSGGTTYNQSSFTGASGFPTWSAATGGNTSYLAGMNASSNQTSNILVYDTYWACSGFSGISTAAQSVTSFSGLPTRAGTGVGSEIWVYCNTATGATASNITVQYTNSSGTSGRNTVSTAHITSMPANRMYQVPLQSGDVGVQSIQSVTLSASTGTTGNFGVMILDRILNIPFQTLNVGTNYDFAAIGFPAVPDETCLHFISQGTATNSGNNWVALKVAQG